MIDHASPFELGVQIVVDYQLTALELALNEIPDQDRQRKLDQLHHTLQGITLFEKWLPSEE